MKYVIICNKNNSFEGKVNDEVYNSVEEALYFISNRGSNVVMDYSLLNWHDKITGTYYKIIPVKETVAATINSSKIYYVVVTKKENNIVISCDIEVSTVPVTEHNETLCVTIDKMSFSVYQDALIYKQNIENNN